MKRRSIAIVTATLAILSISEAVAQTAGGYAMDQLRSELRNDYTYSFENEGNRLVLTDPVSAETRAVLEVDDRGILAMRAPIGKLNAAGQPLATLRTLVSTMNTRLPVGTIVIDPNGSVSIVHHVGVRNASLPATVTAVRMLIDEADRRRTGLALS